jgi:hypothetical protein
MAGGGYFRLQRTQQVPMIELQAMDQFGWLGCDLHAAPCRPVPLQPRPR